ncbi:LytTR family DNA-binding domain-containing protein [Hymenobacter sp. BT730]|uniref:LytR/AlgR family response regulator transcription factor n=1 Tax=Hymenobacter sp. BT730 TaxID=3063332 RepID=UPI0026DEF6F4|nr:LytTR family DNA-binding domain-containing protein [Hymenobacter sp. BT730]
MVKVELCDILYVEGLKDYVKIHLTTGSGLVVKQTINGLEEKPSESNFLRIHRSFIVALDKVQAYNTRHIEVRSQELPIGRLFRQRVDEALTQVRHCSVNEKVMRFSPLRS